MHKRSVRLINYIGYGCGDFLGAGTTALTAAWLLYFYTTFCGLTPIQATTIFAAARVLDAVASPLMGYLTDNFGNTWLGKRFGRRKFFILLGIPGMASYAAMWVGEMNYAYYLFSYLLFDLIYTMVLVPYETLAPEMSNDFTQKAKFSGARILTAQLSAIVAALLPGVLINHFGKDSPSTYFYAALIFTAICMVMLMMVYFFTWERSREELSAVQTQEGPKLGFAQTMKRLFVELTSTLRIRIFRLHLGMYLGGYIAQDVFNAVFTYYVVFVLMQEPTMASKILGVMAMLQFVGVSAAIPLVIRSGPAPAYRIVTSVFGVAAVLYGMLYLTGNNANIVALYGISCLAGLGRGGINYIPWNIYTYIADVDEAVTGQRREGIFAGVMTLTRKASQAGAVMLIGIVMQANGFVTGAKVQSLQVQNTILYLLSAGTIVVLICGIAISLRFKLNQRTHAILRKETERMKAAGRTVPESLAPATRTVIEELTGMPYESLWGNNDIGYINGMRAKSVSSQALATTKTAS